MWRFATRANDHALPDLFTANRTFYIVNDRCLIGVDEFNAFGIHEHQLIKQLQRVSQEVLQRDVFLDKPRFANRQTSTIERDLYVVVVHVAPK